MCPMFKNLRSEVERLQMFTKQIFVQMFEERVLCFSLNSSNI